MLFTKTQMSQEFQDDFLLLTATCSVIRSVPIPRLYLCCHNCHASSKLIVPAAIDANARTEKKGLANPDFFVCLFVLPTKAEVDEREYILHFMLHIPVSCSLSSGIVCERHCMQTQKQNIIFIND